MILLAIETSCDETAIAIIKTSGSPSKPDFSILSNVVSSQIKIHQKFGGVVPTLAAREHVKNLPHVLKSALEEASQSLKIDQKKLIKKIDALAVTQGPGLIPALLIGVNFARALSWRWQKPLIGANHMAGHLYSNLIQKENEKIKFSPYKFPALNLIVSGGHTQLVLMKNYWSFELVGETRDDAAGEAFDKVARLLGLKYPGGPEISRLAQLGKDDAFNFPRPMIGSGNFEFSFSGLKTAVLYEIKKIKKINSKLKADIAASFQKAAIDTLVKKTLKAAEKYNAKSVYLSGGVAANKLLREELENKIQKLNSKTKFSAAPMFLCTDNASMIALAAYFDSIKNKPKLNAWKDLRPDANLRLEFKTP